MKKLFPLLILLLVASFVLAACQPAATEAPAETAAAEEPTDAPEPTEASAEPTDAPEPTEIVLPDLGGREITIAIENAYLPFNYINLETGEAEGWDYDFISEACARLNCVPVYQEFAWDTMIASVAEGQFDMAADGITITEERAQQVDFSDGYIALEQRLLVRIDETRFTNAEELAADAALTIGAQIGTTNYDTAEELVGADRIRTFDDYGLVVQALISGDVDAVVIDETAGLGYQGANSDSVKLVGDSLSSDELGFIFPLGSDLVPAFNAVIAQFKADGTLEALNTTWFGPEFELTYDDIGQGAYGVDPNEIGGVNHPIKVLFVPSVDANIIVTGGEVMATALNEATGLNFEVTVPTSYAATIEEMCASPTDTMAFIPGLGYAVASQLCGVDVAFKAVRFGFPVYWAEFIVQRDSEIQTLADLEGKTWGYGDVTSTSGYMVPLVMLQEAGITPGEQVQTGGHNQTVLAVYNGEVEFGTVFYSVPLTPEGAPVFSYDDFAAGTVTDEMYEVPADAIPNCGPNAEGTQLLCDGWRVLDARANIRVEAPDVMQEVRILAISPAIANDTLSFGPEFPTDVRTMIEEALVAFAETEAWSQSIGSADFYGWSGIAPATDAEYDFIRAMVVATGYELPE